MGDRKHVVIVGGGFGGISAAKKLKKAEVDITLIDRHNHHLFQPLLYQVATAALSPGDIAIPIRAILGKCKGLQVLLGTVSSIDRKGNLSHTHTLSLCQTFSFRCLTRYVTLSRIDTCACV